MHRLPVLLAFNDVAFFPSFPSLFSQLRASSSHKYFYLQGCVFCVFSLLCLIDSNMGFLNGLSSDLFPQEPMTQNHFKDARWECRTLWSGTTGFVVICPADPNQKLQRRLNVTSTGCRSSWKMAGELRVFPALHSVHSRSPEVPRQVRFPVHTQSRSLPIRLVMQTTEASGDNSFRLQMNVRAIPKQKWKDQRNMDAATPAILIQLNISRTGSLYIYLFSTIIEWISMSICV